MQPLLMDPTTTTLIISQSITFFLLIISEILPLTNSQYNGVLQIVLGILKQTAAVIIQPTPSPVIVQVPPSQSTTPTETNSPSN